MQYKNDGIKYNSNIFLLTYVSFTKSVNELLRKIGAEKFIN